MRLPRVRCEVGNSSSAGIISSMTHMTAAGLISISLLLTSTIIPGENEPEPELASPTPSAYELDFSTEGDASLLEKGSEVRMRSDASGEGFLTEVGPRSTPKAVFAPFDDSEEEGFKAIAVAGEQQVDLLWPEIEGENVAIYRDGDALYDGAYVDSYADATVVPGDQYFYEVSVTSTMPREKWPTVLDDQELELVESGEAPPPSEGHTWGISVVAPTRNTEAAATSALASVAKSQPKKTLFRYRTFISNAHIPAPDFGVCSPTTGEYRFGGDNRSWASSGGSSRTNATTTFNWASKKMSHSKSVGSTKRYKKVKGSWKLEAEKKASSNGITQTQKQMSASTGRLYLKVAVKNPFCSYLALPIYAELTLQVKRSGSYSIISGTRRPVPHHEAYIKRDSDSWTTVLRKTNKGFDCLARLNFCGYDSLVKDGKY